MSERPAGEALCDDLRDSVEFDRECRGGDAPYPTEYLRDIAAGLVTGDGVDDLVAAFPEVAAGAFERTEPRTAAREHLDAVIGARLLGVPEDPRHLAAARDAAAAYVRTGVGVDVPALSHDYALCAAALAGDPDATREARDRRLRLPGFERSADVSAQLLHATRDPRPATDGASCRAATAAAVYDAFERGQLTGTLTAVLTRCGGASGAVGELEGCLADIDRDLLDAAGMRRARAGDATWSIVRRGGITDLELRVPIEGGPIASGTLAFLLQARLHLLWTGLQDIYSGRVVLASIRGARSKRELRGMLADASGRVCLVAAYRFPLAPDGGLVCLRDRVVAGTEWLGHQLDGYRRPIELLVR